MKLITNTNEIKYGDIILGLPKKNSFDTVVFIRTGKYTDVRYNSEDSCFDIKIWPGDIESFSEECYLVKCIMVNDELHFVDLKTSGTFCWDLDIDTRGDEYSIWKLDIKI